MPTYTSYDQVGKAEDVSDIITDISPTDTPFYSSIRTEKVNARVFEWQEDSLAAAANNAQVEGADPTMATLTATTLRTNNCQIMTKAFQVSATADAIKTYGRAKETALKLVAQYKPCELLGSLSQKIRLSAAKPEREGSTTIRQEYTQVGGSAWHHNGDDIV